MLVALTGWFIPVKTASKTKHLENKQIALQKESVIYKTDAPIQPISRPLTSRTVEKRSSKKQTITPNRNSGRSNSGRNYPAGTADKEAVKALIIKYSEQYGINSQVPLCIAYHESGYNSHSRNKSSTASGVFQYLQSTWRATDEGKAGLSVFDAESNVKAAIKYMASRKSTQPWEVRNKCPKL